MTRRHRPLPPSVLLHALAIMVVVAVIGLTGCSDAHSQAQLDLSNPGYDPTTIIILAPTALSTTLHDLGSAFKTAHPNISFLLVSDVMDNLKRVRSHRRYKPLVAANAKASLSASPEPSLWIDTSGAIRTLLPPATQVYGVKQLFGYDRVALVVKPGNPDRVPGLSAFAKGSPFRTGLCAAHTTCGGLGRAALNEAHITPQSHVGGVTGAELIAEVLRGRIQAALTTTSEAATAGVSISTIPIRPTPTTFSTYETLRLDGSQAAREFAGWLTTSPVAALILAEHGIVRTVAATR